MFSFTSPTVKFALQRSCTALPQPQCSNCCPSRSISIILGCRHAVGGSRGWCGCWRLDRSRNRTEWHFTKRFGSLGTLSCFIAPLRTLRQVTGDTVDDADAPPPNFPTSTNQRRDRRRAQDNKGRLVCMLQHRARDFPVLNTHTCRRGLTVT